MSGETDDPFPGDYTDGLVGCVIDMGMSLEDMEVLDCSTYEGLLVRYLKRQAIESGKLTIHHLAGQSQINDYFSRK